MGISLYHNLCTVENTSRLWQAKQLAKSMGYTLPQHFKVIEVPCEGSISINHSLSTFENGADGVLLLACHEGNCHSEKGNIISRQRVDRLTKFFPKIRFEQERLKLSTLASNMGKEFADILLGFEKEINDLRASRVKEE